MTDKHDEFEQHLRSLFDEERLTLSTAPGARDAVLAGARRVRRRREVAMAGGGVAVVAVAAVGGLMIARPPSAGDSEMAAGPGTTTMTTETTTTAPESSRPGRPSRSAVEEVESSRIGTIPSDKPRSSAPAVSDAPSALPDQPAFAAGPIGPSGWGGLELGMSFQQAQATGYIAADAAAPSGCTSYPLTTGGDVVSSVLISESGLGRIVASGGRSPEDRGIGSPVEDLYAAYPSGTEQGSEFRADSGGGGTYVFVMGEDAVAKEFSLTNGGC